MSRHLSLTLIAVYEGRWWIGGLRLLWKPFSRSRLEEHKAVRRDPNFGRALKTSPSFAVRREVKAKSEKLGPVYLQIMNKNIKAVTNKQTFHGDRQLPSVTWATFLQGQIPLRIAKWQAACARLMEICNCETHKLGAQHAAEEQIAVIPFSHQAVRHACPWYLEINIGVHSAWPAAHLLRQALSYTHMHAGAKTALCALSKCELWYMAWQFVFKWCQQIQ